MRGRIERQGYNIQKSNTANLTISKLSIDFSGYKSISVTYDTLGHYFSMANDQDYVTTGKIRLSNTVYDKTKKNASLRF